jgi:hypothetical protein
MRTLKSRFALFVLGFSVIVTPSIALAVCSYSITTDQLGDGQKYNCYLQGQDANYCYYDCYAP